MMPELRKKIAISSFKSLLGQSHHYYLNNFSGSLANKINNLTDAVPDIFQMVTDRFFANGLAISVAVYTLWQVNSSFALASLIWCGVFIATSFLFSDHLAKLSDDFSEIGSQITGRFVDVLSNILSVRLFARSKYEETSLNKNTDKAIQAERKVEWFNFWMWGIGSYSFLIIQSINIYFLITYLEKGLVSVGDFALVLTLNSAIIDCLWGFAKDFSRFSKLFGKITQGMRSILHIAEIQDKPDALALHVTKPSIVFSNVGFNYNGHASLFANLNIEILAGQKIGLVGYSGSGKTTFVNLIMRLYELESGSIMIDGQNITKVTQDSLRTHIAMIPQDPALFHRSLMDNIRYGNVGATDEEVIEAAKRAHAHEFIVALSEGYNSLVGEKGVKLSGGQRQRIAIARAILKNAPILILDEATSQLDSVTESYIQESLLELMNSGNNKTTI